MCYTFAAMENQPKTTESIQIKTNRIVLSRLSLKEWTLLDQLIEAKELGDRAFAREDFDSAASDHRHAIALSEKLGEVRRDIAEMRVYQADCIRAARVSKKIHRGAGEGDSGLSFAECALDAPAASSAPPQSDSALNSLLTCPRCHRMRTRALSEAKAFCADCDQWFDVREF